MRHQGFWNGLKPELRKQHSQRLSLLSSFSKWEEFDSVSKRRRVGNTGGNIVGKNSQSTVILQFRGFTFEETPSST